MMTVVVEADDSDERVDNTRQGPSEAERRWDEQMKTGLDKHYEEQRAKRARTRQRILEKYEMTSYND